MRPKKSHERGEMWLRAEACLLGVAIVGGYALAAVAAWEALFG